jgi:isoamyl acetate esterase
LVPIDRYEENLREYVETILNAQKLNDTKIILITPPPINIPDALPDPDGEEESAEVQKNSQSYRTYMNKKRYAEKVMEIAESYASSGRVAGLNYWKALIDAALADQHRLGDEDAYDENRLPGCGLSWAKEFRDGYFTDGLHLNVLVRANPHVAHACQY